MVKFLDIYQQDKVKFRKNIKDIKNIIKNTNFINGKNGGKSQSCVKSPSFQEEVMFKIP